MEERIFITGDVHYPIDCEKLFTLQYNCSLTPADTLIVCGDFGVTWYGKNSQQDESAKRQISRLECTVLFVDGNHENHPDLSWYPKVSKFGAEMHQITDNCFHMMRGQIYTIADKTFFTMGGAHSIDKRFRTAGVSWWPEEEPSLHELQYGRDNLERVGNKVDYIVTHDCPSSIYSFLYDGIHEHQILPGYFEDLTKKVEFEGWFFGHHHKNFTVNRAFSRRLDILDVEANYCNEGTFVGLYNSILQIYPSLKLVLYRE